MAASEGGEAERVARWRALVDEHFEFVWRVLRRLGVPEADTDDAAQEVLLTASRRLDAIEVGSERAFLFAVAYRVAMHVRRSLQRRREVPLEAEVHESRERGAEELSDELRARCQIDTILDSMPMDMRTVFILFELEEMTLAQIAQALDIPQGTAASRLRRAREHFRVSAKRLRERNTRGGTP
jgi:RNA polymerase sigma-70 factor (ECF subfamily)